MRTAHASRIRPRTAAGILALTAVAAIVACGGAVNGSSSGSNTQDCGPSSASGACPTAPTSTTTSTPPGTATNVPPTIPPGRVPKVHRASAKPCDSIRPTTEPVDVPDAGPPGYIECRSNAECTQGANGRCSGNGHDGWRCTYDECFSDSQCGSKEVCECESGFRADNNVCLKSECRVDADCGSGRYCSPTLGSCGHYGGIQGYYCHTPQDECTDDADCSGGGNPPASCRYEPTVGHWKCSTQECAG